MVFAGGKVRASPFAPSPKIHNLTQPVFNLLILHTARLTEDTVPHPPTSKKQTDNGRSTDATSDVTLNFRHALTVKIVAASDMLPAKSPTWNVAE